jgi:ribosomal protein S18 acetylase RimI-like enzyme
MEENKYKIKNTVEADLPIIYWLFEEAIAYQRQKGYPVWAGYDKKSLQNDILQNLQFKIIIEDSIACIFSICHSDPIIWRDKECGNAIYLHRIVVNPKMKGQNQFAKIMNWAKTYAIEKDAQFIRMDTWGDNQHIINYYKGYGFQFVENYTTPNSKELPTQHRNLYLALLEYQIDKV